MRLYFAFSIATALALGGCSSPSAPDQAPSTPRAIAPAASATATELTLGSPAWYAWVNDKLGINSHAKDIPEPGTPDWNRLIQRKLGQEAPQSKPGSSEWQQSVDSLLRTRVPASTSSTH